MDSNGESSCNNTGLLQQHRTHARLQLQLTWINTTGWWRPIGWLILQVSFSNTLQHTASHGSFPKKNLQNLLQNETCTTIHPRAFSPPCNDMGCNNIWQTDTSQAAILGLFRSLQHTATYCNTMQNNAKLCITLSCSCCLSCCLTLWNTLQHTVTHLRLQLSCCTAQNQRWVCGWLSLAPARI